MTVVIVLFLYVFLLDCLFVCLLHYACLWNVWLNTLRLVFIISVLCLYCEFTKLFWPSYLLVFNGSWNFNSFILFKQKQEKNVFKNKVEAKRSWVWNYGKAGTDTLTSVKKNKQKNVLGQSWWSKIHIKYSKRQEKIDVQSN